MRRRSCSNIAAVAEFSAKKLKRGREKNGWPEKIYCRILSKVAEKEPKFCLCNCLIAEMRKMTQVTKKFAQHLDFCRKLVDKKLPFR